MRLTYIAGWRDVLCYSAHGRWTVIEVTRSLKEELAMPIPEPKLRIDVIRPCRTPIAKGGLSFDDGMILSYKPSIA